MYTDQVLGGLVEDRCIGTKSKGPLLGHIPVGRARFRSEGRTKNRTNLMVFLRPVVLRDAPAGDRLSLDRYDLIRAQQKDAQPVPHPMLPLKDTPVLPPLRPGLQTPAQAPAAPVTTPAPKTTP